MVPYIIKDCKKIFKEVSRRGELQILSRDDLITFTLRPSGVLSGCGQLARPKIWGDVTLATPFSKIFKRTPGLSLESDTPAKFEVRIFNRFGAISI